MPLPPPGKKRTKTNIEKTAHAMAHWLREFLSGFPGGADGVPIDDPEYLQLPDNNDLIYSAPLRDKDLAIITHEMTLAFRGIGVPILWNEIKYLSNSPRTEQLISTFYHRVTGHPVLDAPYRGLRSRRLKDPLPREENSDFLRTVYGSIHNVLCFLRLQWQLVEKREVYHATRRIMTYFQEKWGEEKPGVGLIGEGIWWIAPDCYMLEVDPTPGSEVEEVYELSADALTAAGDEDIATAFGTDRKDDVEKFARAIYTFHIVYLQEADWALIIRHSTSNTAICIDPVHGGEQTIWSRVENAFNDWLGRSGQTHIKTFRYPTVPAVTSGDWTSAIHVIAHALTFLRYGQPNWADLSRWQHADTKLPDTASMVAGIVESLHRLMGVTTREISKRLFEEDQDDKKESQERRKRVKTVDDRDD